MVSTPSDSPSSLAALIERRASQSPGDAYLLEARGSRVVTFADLAWRAGLERAWLADRGLSPGARLGLVIGDPLTFCRLFLAALSAGLWVAPLDPTAAPGVTSHVAQQVRDLALEAVVGDRPRPSGVEPDWFELAGASSSEPRAGHDGGGIVLSSSGTTGAPKVVTLALDQVLAVAHLVASHHGLAPGERGFSPLPLWHINAEVVGVLAALDAGSSLVLDDRFHRTGFWKVVDASGATWVNAVPAIIARLLQGDEGDAVPPRVRFVRTASAPLAPALGDAFERATGVAVIQSYGMTEAASQICVNPLDGRRKPGSVGRPVGVELRVVSLEERSRVPTGTVGSIEIRGPTVITRYEGGAYADRFDAQGWLSTGDLGFVDEDGYVFLVGRSDDVINRGGEKVYPLELEHVLAAVEGVAAVAVVGECDDVFGQVPVAFIQPRDPVDLSGSGAAALVERVRRAVRDSLARPQRPARVKLVTAFTTHATGKIQRGGLRDGTLPVAYVEAL
jgi:acyl-CoA synthetase (AMP-forming)/AMP-acid ligase II